MRRLFSSFCFIVIMLYGSVFLSVDQPSRSRKMFLKRLYRFGMVLPKAIRKAWDWDSFMVSGMWDLVAPQRTVLSNQTSSFTYFINPAKKFS